MRILLVWTNPGHEAKQLISGLRQAGQEVVYWVGVKEGDEQEFPDIVFHDHLRAWNALPALGISLFDFYPPSEDLIKKMHHAESILLTNMNKHFEPLSVDQRKHIYYIMLRYWHGVIDKYKPELIIFPMTPHAVYDYLLYELAQIIGLKTFMFYPTAVSDRWLYFFDFWKGSDKLLEEISKNSGKNFSVEDLNTDLQEYYRKQTNLNQDPTPQSMENYRRKSTWEKRMIFKIKLIIQSLKNFSIFKKIYSYFLKLFGDNIRREYHRVQVEPDFNKKFIYVALNYQPENTTSPLGGVFVDLILMIEMLSAAVPSNWIIYVKEHPTQWFPHGLNFFDSRYKGYYKTIARLPNVKIIPITTNTYKLIDRSQLVATATGTVAWEAVFRGKPAIIFGYPWFRHCHGIFRVNNVENCRQVIEKIMNGFKVDQQQVINYLKNLDNATIHSFDGKQINVSILIDTFLQALSRIN